MITVAGGFMWAASMQIRDVGERAGNGLLIGPGAPAHRDRGRARRSAVLHDFARDVVDRGDAHEDDQCFRLAGLAPVDGCDIVARDECHQLGMVAMGERHAAVGRDPEGRRHAGDHFERNAGVGQSFQLFAAASEDEWVAAFQTHDREAAARAVDHHAADLFLRECMDGFLLTDVDAFAIFGSQIEEVLVGEVIVED